MSKPRTKILFSVTAICAVIFYSVGRTFFTILFSSDHSLVVQISAATILLIETFTLLHCTGYLIDLITVARAKKEDRPISTKITTFSRTVAILVPARHEPRELLEGTFLSLINLKYSAKTIYLLDDSSDEKYVKDALEISKKFGINLFRRDNRVGAKAGIINDCLKTLTETYIAVFDADQRPGRNFLSPLIPILEADEKIAFIQTPQFYSNIGDNRVARGAQIQQSIFYEYICEAKNVSTAMFCCGTNVVFRREALLDVGGMDASVVTEDIATSLKMHMRGWKSIYYGRVSAFGKGPENLASYFQQQSRWASGTVGVYRKLLKNFLFNPRSLTLYQWWEYFLSTTYYFTGIVIMIFMVCPPAYIVFGIPSFFVSDEAYLVIFLPYFALSLSIFYTSLTNKNYRMKDLILAQVLAYIAFPVTGKAAISALFGWQGRFRVTPKIAGTRLSYFSLLPQLSLFLLNYIALIWGIERLSRDNDWPLIVNCFWAFYHCLIMLGVFYFNASPKPKLKT